MIRILSFLVLLFSKLWAQCGEEKVLHIYGWAGSIPPALLAQFEEETGIKVTYDAYDSNDILEAKLLTGRAQFDLVFPSITPNFIRQLQVGVFQPINRDLLPNYKNLDPRILGLIAPFDPQNTYGVPYTLGTTGFGYNKKTLVVLLPEGIPHSLSLIFSKPTMAKLKGCGVLLLDAPQDLLEAAQSFLGEAIPQCHVEEKVQRALTLMRTIRPHVKDFTANADRAVRELSSGESCVVHMWSSDALLAQRENPDIGYIIPKEWPGLWVDMMAIPKNAKHPKNAHRFIDFLLRAPIAAEVVKATLMAVPNRSMKPFLPKDLQNNPMVFIPDYALKNLRIQENLDFKAERRLIRQWTHFKLGW